MNSIPVTISKATITDIEGLVRLLNSAYRGPAAQKGWTSESHLIAGDTRTDAGSLAQLVEQPDSTLLKCTDDKDTIIGSMHLQQEEAGLYLGMLSVSPLQQGQGIGKKLLEEAELFARQLQCKRIYMTVISLRTELIDWYKRHGYTDTGKRKPFIEDALSGKHLQPLEFAVLEKQLHP